jgi:hypothetical protein
MTNSTWVNNWANYEACPYDGEKVKRAHAKHDELEAFLLTMGDTASVYLDGGRMRVAVERVSRYYHEDISIRYTKGLSVRVYKGQGYMCHRKHQSYELYGCCITSPTEALMLYTKALTDALAINTLLPGGIPKPIVNMKRKLDRLHTAKVQHQTIAALLLQFEKEQVLTDGSTICLKGVNRSPYAPDCQEVLKLTDYPLVGIQVVVTSAYDLDCIYIGTDIVEAQLTYTKHQERIGTPGKAYSYMVDMRDATQYEDNGECG